MGARADMANAAYATCNHVQRFGGCTFTHDADGASRKNRTRRGARTKQFRVERRRPACTRVGECRRARALQVERRGVRRPTNGSVEGILSGSRGHLLAALHGSATLDYPLDLLL